MAAYDRQIVEQSRNDDYWGAKIVSTADDTLTGQNILGRLLMELRELLKNDADGVLKVVLPLKIPDFLLLGKPIETVTSRFRRADHSLISIAGQVQRDTKVSPWESSWCLRQGVFAG